MPITRLHGRTIPAFAGMTRSEIIIASMAKLAYTAHETVIYGIAR